jgi:hypothetical protein
MPVAFRHLVVGAALLALLSACEQDKPKLVETEVRGRCAAGAGDRIERRAEFIVDCLKVWNPGEEEWAQHLGDKCEELADRTVPPIPRADCISWSVEVREGFKWHSCDVQTHPDIINKCKKAGWKPAE